MEIVDEKLLTVKDVAKGLRERGYNLSEKALYKIVKENDFKHVRRINKGRKIAWFFEEEFLDELINYLEAERNKLTAPKIYSILKKEGINISMETLYKILRKAPIKYIEEKRVTPTGKIYLTFKREIIDYLLQKLS